MEVNSNSDNARFAQKKNANWNKGHLFTDNGQTSLICRKHKKTLLLPVAEEWKRRLLYYTNTNNGARWTMTSSVAHHRKSVRCSSNWQKKLVGYDTHCLRVSRAGKIRQQSPCVRKCNLRVAKLTEADFRFERKLTEPWSDHSLDFIVALKL